MRRRIFPYNPYLKELARQHRNNSTKAEVRLWIQLKGDQMLGFDFHRQKAIDNYILDFFCHELMLGIEVDGITHQSAEVREKDIIKEKRMGDFGITVLRYTDEEVLEDMDYVLKTLREWIVGHTPTSAKASAGAPGPSEEGN